MAPSFSGVWNISTQYQYRTGWPVDANLGAVGITTRGQTNPLTTNIDKFLVASSSGNATDFGDLTVARHASSSMGNDTRGIFAGGWDNYGGSSLSNVVDYITYATAGNATDFGDVAATSSDANASASNNVRGITFGGRLVSNGNIDNAIEYITIASTGNATDFADLSITTGTTANKARHRQGNGMSGSSTRGLASGGYTPAALSDTIQYVTIASAGNSVDFGNMSASTDELGFMSSNTRAVIAGGSAGGSSFRNTMEYVTIASTGNVTDFGDITVAKAFLMGASGSTKGFIIGGGTASNINTSLNTIETITFSTTGNGTDFGDLTSVGRSGSANTSGHAAVQNESFFSPAAIGVLGGGYGNNEAESIIEYMNIASDGQVGVFGDLINPAYSIGSGAASTTRGVSFGGNAGSRQDVIEFITFSTKGKATDFGNLATAKDSSAGFSSNTRGITGGGDTGSKINVIEYITIASAGNSTDFGDLTVARERLAGSSSTTRGVFGGGIDTGPNLTDVIDYITIASTGNATDFGNLSAAKQFVSGCSSNTRALFIGGRTSGLVTDVEYVTIASTGNVTDFGDLSTASDRTSAVSDKTTALVHPALTNLSITRLDKFTIASTGNASDYGDLTAGNYGPKFSASNSHGGIA